MPELDLVSIGIIAGMTVPAWETAKWAFHVRRDRHSTWISFLTLEGASEAAKRVDQYYGDSGKRSEARVAWLRTNPRVEVRVPNAMLIMTGFDASVRRFRYDIESEVESLKNTVEGALEYVKEENSND